MRCDWEPTLKSPVETTVGASAGSPTVPITTLPSFTLKKRKPDPGPIPAGVIPLTLPLSFELCGSIISPVPARCSVPGPIFERLPWIAFSDRMDSVVFVSAMLRTLDRLGWVSIVRPGISADGPV